MTENSPILGFTIFQASCMGKASNCEYPHEIRVTDAESLKLAARRDYVCARYQNSYRSVANFMEADCVGMDVDNDHSDSPEDWIHPEDIRKVFPDVTLGVHYSRHHMKPKKNRTARPRYHVFLACRRAEDSEAYKQLKERLQRVFPYFDTNAQDAARFFFGTRDGACDFFPGTVTINECLDMYYPEDGDTDDPLELLDPANPIDNTIQEGHRNATLSHFAGRILKRLGPTEEAHDLFLRRAAACDPPLEEEELEHIWRSAKGFYSRISQQQGYLSPEEYEKNNQRQYDPDDRTDVGQAELLRDLAGERLRYSPNVGYLTYDGVCWEESEQMAQGEAQTLTRLQLEEARAEMELTWDRCKEYGVDELLEQMPKRKAKECMNRDQLAVYEKYESATHYYEWAENRRSSKYIRATMQQVTSMVPIRTSELDADHLLLNCPEHSYDLRHGIREAREHRPGDYCTKVTSVEPSDEGMELWQDCLKKIFCGDEALIEYVQQICGLACVGKVFFEAMIIAYGDGRNGKSTFWNTIFRVMGTYAKTISAETLTTSCKRNTLPEMAELKGCRLVLASELKEGLSLNTSVVKQLTSTDPIHAEKKYFAPFDFQPTHTLVLYTNHLPKVRALDAGIWRRLIVVPFNARIEGKGDIKNYSDFLVEHAGGAVMKWILEGAQKVIAEDYRIQEPEIVQTAIAEYRENNDWLRPFLDEKCDVGKQYKEASGQFYIAYRAYCESTGEFIRSTTDFYGALATYGFERHKTKIGNFIHGVRLKANSEDDDGFLE